MWNTSAEVMIMAKKGMKHPDVTRGPRNETSPVHQIQGKAKSGKEKANPIIAGTTGANQKVWHEKPISKAHGIIDTDLARDNLENDIPFAGGMQSGAASRGLCLHSVDGAYQLV